MVLDSRLHPLAGKNIAIITITGCKTGKLIETPVNVVRVGRALVIISFRNRTWWRNLRDGRVASLRLAGKQYSVRSEVIEAPTEVANNLKDYFTQYPGYAKYFRISLEADRSPSSQQLNALAEERVIVKLCEV